MQIEEGSFKNPRNIDLKYRLMLPYEHEADENHKFPLVILVHGFGGSINSAYIKRALHKVSECGVAAFSFNLTNMHKGTGVDTSNLTPENALEDLKTAMEFIKHHPKIDASRIVGVAASFGAYTLMRYEAEMQDDALKALILFSAVPVPLKPFEKYLTPVKMRFWRMIGHVAQEVDGFKCRISYKLYEECKRIDILGDVAPKITKPVTLVHGDNDILTSLEDLYMLKNALRKSPEVNTYVMHGAEHEFGYIPRTGHEHSEFEQAVSYVQTIIRDTFRKQEKLADIETEEDEIPMISTLASSFRRLFGMEQTR